MDRINDGMSNSQRYYWRCVALRRCTHCGRPWRGRTRTCEDCLIEQRLKDKARRKPRQCRDCPQVLGNPHHVLCATCAVINRIRKRKAMTIKRRLWLAQGKCPQCAAHRKLAVGRRRCKRCLAIAAASQLGRDRG